MYVFNDERCQREDDERFYTLKIIFFSHLFIIILMKFFFLLVLPYMYFPCHKSTQRSIYY